MHCYWGVLYFSPSTQLPTMIMFASQNNSFKAMLPSAVLLYEEANKMALQCRAQK